jgi:UDP-glucose 4-epimerase
MRIIITGGAGFIASHVTDAYIKAGHKVAVIDNLLTGSRKNINPKAKFYKTDIRNLPLVEKIFRRERPRVVNHHAAFISVVESVRDPATTFETNILGTLNVLRAFGKYSSGSGKKIIFSSTGGAIYGNPRLLPADEQTRPSPLSPYALSKLLAEKTIEFFAPEYGIKYTIFRYSNVYGPRQNPNGEAGVVAIFGNLLKKGLRPKIFGDGTKTRDYVYVDDVVRANILGLKRGRNEIINICTGKETSDQEIFNAIADALKAKQKPIYAPLRAGEVRRIAMSFKKAKKILGWQPKIGLRGGIKKTLAIL